MNPRERMVWEIKVHYGLTSPRVLSSISKVPREDFVSPHLKHLAYEDRPLSIGHGQTISQPYTVAFMTHLLFMDKKSHFAKASRDWRVLEVGTGSGYQAAILSILAKEVYTVERIDALAREARKRLKKLGYANVEVRTGSGEFGWRDKAPFDAIVVTAGTENVPKRLFDQLKVGGVLVAPVGRGGDKVMMRYKKGRIRISKKQYGVFSFVPFVKSDGSASS